MAYQFQHPSSLNPWQQYRQACSILSHTSRASNPAWYQQALELDLQLHIRPDGPQVISAYFERSTGQWSAGPKLNEEVLRDREAFEPIAQEILAHAKTNKASAIGVIVHLADEFATAELKPELDNPGSISDLAQKAANEPDQILEDTSANASEASFRIVPYAAAGSELIGTTVTISRQMDPALEVLRQLGEDKNFPIITQSVSAPLIALLGLPGMLTTQPEKPFVTILQYPWFTVLAFFNEHADLKLIRTLQHRGMRKAANFRNALFATSASLEFMDPDLYLVPLGEEIDTELEQHLSMNFPNSKVLTLKVPKADGIPDWAPEPLIATNEATTQGVVSSMTFTSFREEQWPFQDFLPMRREQVEIYPAKKEMGMLRITKLFRIFILIIALAGLGYMGLDIVNLIRTPEWSFDAGNANASKSKLTQLNQEKLRAAQLDNILQDRSKAWEAMEFLSLTFPKDSNTLVTDMKYSARTDAGLGQAMASLVRTWKISGFARDEALEHLNKLNTRSGIKEHFDKVAEITGSKAYKTDIGNRSISVNIRTRENNSYRQQLYDETAMNEVTSYPFSFDLTISQRFESNDPMALSLAPIR